MEIHFVLAVLLTFAVMSLRAENENCTIDMCAGKLLCSREQCNGRYSQELSTMIEGETVCCDPEKYSSLGFTMDPETKEHLCFCEDMSNLTTNVHGHGHSTLGSVLDRPFHSLLSSLIGL